MSRPFQLREGSKRYDPLNAPGQKKCKTCKASKDRTEFNKSRGNADGLQSDCRKCQNEMNRANINKKKVDRDKYFDF
jgi:hypothetical protein